MATMCNSIKDAFHSCFPRKWIMNTAISIGLVQRQRKVNIIDLFWTIVLGFGTGAHKTLAELRRLFEYHSGVELVPSAFYDRFTPQLCAFMKKAVVHACNKLSEPVESLKGKLKGFVDLVIADSTVFKLHDMLKDIYTARRNRRYESAMKLHVVISALGVSPRSVRLYSERTWDGNLVRIGPWIKGRLILFDMGYFSYSLFERVDRNKGFFITRLKDNANPKILFSHRLHRGRCQPIETKKLRSILPRLKRSVFDTQIEVTVTRRSYQGVRHKIARTFRLVGIMNEETGKYHIYVTNIPPEKLEAEDIARTYAARWEVELMFKELKSHFRLHEIPSQQRHIVETLVYAAILTFVISRALLFILRKHLRVPIDRTPERRWTRIFQNAAIAILRLLTSGRQLTRWWEDLEKFLAHEFIDPNHYRTLRLNYGRA
jgi:putative transposase